MIDIAKKSLYPLTIQPAFFRKCHTGTYRCGTKERAETARLFINLGFYYRNEERFVDAFDAYQQAIGIFERTGSLGDRMTYAYKNAAQILVRWDNHTLAGQYFNEALRVDTSGKYRAAIYAQFANDSHFKGDETAVMDYYLLGMAEPRPRRDDEQTAHLQAAGSTAFTAQHKYREVAQMLQAALDFYQTDTYIFRQYPPLPDGSRRYLCPPE
ncbi:MAG: tetratricopeptide repeat protein [Lewinellaceae bacterium]|nr:tetratricopeptide repeat protein [Lewinellaceae bacterium]